MIIEAKNVFYRFKNRDLLKDLNFKYKHEDIICVLGNNGVGKSILFKIISGILESYSGSINIDNKNLKEMSLTERSLNISWLGQNLSRPENFNVLDFLTLQKKNLDVTDLTREFALEGILTRELSHLSAGEWKRVQIARIWGSKSKILLLDEPDNDLDLYHKLNLIEKCKEYVVQCNAIIFIVTHDLSFSKQVSNNIFALSNGFSVYNTSAEAFWESNIIYKLFGLKNSQTLL